MFDLAGADAGSDCLSYSSDAQKNRDAQVQLVQVAATPPPSWRPSRR